MKSEGRANVVSGTQRQEDLVRSAELGPTYGAERKREGCVKIQLVRQEWPDPTGPADNINEFSFISKSRKKLRKGLQEK